MTPETWNFNRSWQGRALGFLTLATVLLSAFGVYTLRTAPALFFESGVWFSLGEPEVRRIAHLDLDPTASLRLPEFFSPHAEARWWQMQQQLYALLSTHPSVPVTFIDQTGGVRSEQARVGMLPWSVVLKRTWLIYFVVAVCLSSAVSVFRRHRSPPGSVLAFFLLAIALYFASSAPVVGRSLTLSPFAFKLLVFTLYTAASGLPTLAHFALIFPEPKEILRRRPWIAALPYGSFLLTTLLYLSGVGAFGTTFPLVGIWVLVVVGASLHSLLQASDPFLQRQLRLSLTAPALVSLFFIGLYLLPGVLRLPPVDFRFFALFFLILPFALPLAMDNLALYNARLAAERTAQQEKEQLRGDLHDLILNNLASISRTSEVARTRLNGAFAVETRLQSIQELATQTSQRLREFLWVLDDRHRTWDVLCSHLRRWGQERLEDSACDLTLEVEPALLTLPPPALRLRVCLDRVYKEAVWNIVKHARANCVEVTFVCRGTTLVCVIADNGVGFTVEGEVEGHYGLANMRRRVEALGGTVTIVSTPGEGTCCTIELPLHEKYPNWGIVS